jgi:dipeptidase E
MKNILLASTSTLFGGQYLEYLHDEIKDVFNGVDEIVFIPFARPSGLSHDDYTAKAAGYFATLGINVKGLHLFADPADALQKAKGVFTGGGNTFLLTRQMHELNLFPVLKERVESGMPYMGASAGSNIAGLNIRTTNDICPCWCSQKVARHCWVLSKAKVCWQKHQQHEL